MANLFTANAILLAGESQAGERRSMQVGKGARARIDGACAHPHSQVLQAEKIIGEIRTRAAEVLARIQEKEIADNERGRRCDGGRGGGLGMREDYDVGEEREGMRLDSRRWRVDPTPRAV